MGKATINNEAGWKRLGQKPKADITEHLDRVSGIGDTKRMREKKKHIACGSYTEIVQGIHERMGADVLLAKWFGWSGDPFGETNWIQSWKEGQFALTEEDASGYVVRWIWR